MVACETVGGRPPPDPPCPFSNIHTPWSAGKGRSRAPSHQARFWTKFSFLSVSITLSPGTCQVSLQITALESADYRRKAPKPTRCRFIWRERPVEVDEVLTEGS